MGNRLFKGTILLLLAITVLFLASPVLTLIAQGISYIIPCFASEEILFSIALSMKTSLLSTAICMAVALVSGYAIYSLGDRPKKVLENIIYTPMSLPHIVSGIALLLLFGRHGIGDFLDGRFSLDFIFTVKGIVLAQVFVNLPFAIRIVQTSLESVDKKKVFISRTLGCSEMQSFLYITLPYLKRGIVSGAIMTWSKALGEFGAVMMVAGTTRMKTEVIPVAIYLNMATGDMDMAIGTATILIGISLSSTFLFNMMGSAGRRG